MSNNKLVEKSRRYFNIAVVIIIVSILISLGSQIIHSKLEQKRAQYFTSQVIEKIANDENAKKLIGDNYTIASSPPTQIIPGKNKSSPVKLSFCISSESGLVFVSASVNENQSVGEVWLTPYNGTQQIVIKK